MVESRKLCLGTCREVRSKSYLVPHKSWGTHGLGAPWAVAAAVLLLACEHSKGPRPHN